MMLRTFSLIILKLFLFLYSLYLFYVSLILVQNDKLKSTYFETVCDPKRISVHFLKICYVLYINLSTVLYKISKAMSIFWITLFVKFNKSSVN